MHRYERIEQMEREIEEICDNIPAEHCNISECHSCISAYLVDRGYRKASDVAREIFADFTKHKVCTNEEDFRVLAELKKKYIPKDCRTCKHMLSCEPNVFGICDEYEEKKDD